MRRHFHLMRYLFVVWVCMTSPLPLTADHFVDASESNIAKSKGSPQALFKMPAYEYDFTVRALAFGTYTRAAKTSQNPNNDFLNLPRCTAEFELRPDFQLHFERSDFSVKPRLTVSRSKWEDGSRHGESDTDSELFINEWLARVRLVNGFFASYGRENLQWGPSFLVSPSNPFFRDNGRSNPIREVPGMDFGRLVYAPTWTWSLSFIANLDQGRNDLQFRNSEFRKTYALKLDHTDSERYASLILSAREEDRVRLGAYGGVTATDALLLYAEGEISQGTDALYPTLADNILGGVMAPTKDDDTDLSGTLLLGGSYTLEWGPTVTMEYLYNGPGYDDEQADAYFGLRDKAGIAFELDGPISGLGASILGQTADPRLRFLRQHYIMVQLLENDIRDILNLTLRWNQNIDDGSGQLLFWGEYFLGDHLKLFSFGVVNSGGDDTEFGSILDHQIMMGLEVSF